MPPRKRKTNVNDVKENSVARPKRGRPTNDDDSDDQDSDENEYISSDEEFYTPLLVFGFKQPDESESKNDRRTLASSSAAKSIFFLLNESFFVLKFYLFLIFLIRHKNRITKRISKH